MRLILVFGLICQSSLVWCRSVQNEKNPGQKLAQLLLPLLDDALDPSGDDASLLEVHPHKDGKRKVELTPLNSKTKKDPKPLAIILTSNLADLKKKKERKIRKGLVDEVTSGETSEASKEQRIRTKKIPARGRLPKIFMNEIRHKPRHISRKNIKVPHYKLKGNKKPHKKYIVDNTEEDTSEEVEKRIQRHYNKLSNGYLRRPVPVQNKRPVTVQNIATTDEVTFEDDLDSDSSVVSESTRETNESDNESTNELTIDRTSSDVTDSVTSEDDETKEIPILRKLKHSKVVPEIPSDVNDSSNHDHKKIILYDNLSVEVTEEQVTKETEDKKHKTAELSSAEITHEIGSSDGETKQVTSEEVDKSKEKHDSKSNENSKEKHHHDEHVSHENTEEQHLGHSVTKETLSSETKETVSSETKEITKETSEVKSEEKGETSENHSKTAENDLITAEITKEITSEVYDIDSSRVTSEITQEHTSDSKNESADESKQVSASESNETNSKNELGVEDHHKHKTKQETNEASGETSESQIDLIEYEKSTSQEETHEKHAHSHKHHHVETGESGVDLSEESTKHHSKHAETKELHTNEVTVEMTEEAENSDVTKTIEEEVAENHWVRHRGKPGKESSKVTKNAKSRRVVDSSSAEHSKKHLGTGSWGVEDTLKAAHKKKDLGTGSWGVESSSAEHKLHHKSKKHVGTGSWGVESSSAEHSKKHFGTGSWGVEDSLWVEHKKPLGTGSWGIESSSAEHSAEHSVKYSRTGSWGVESASAEHNKKHLGTRRSPNSSWGVDATHSSSSEHKVPHYSKLDKSNEKPDKENHKSSSEHKHSHVSNAKHVSGKIDAHINHNTISEHRHHSDVVPEDHKTIGHSNSEHHLHASLELHKEKSGRRRSDKSSSEHNISLRPKCQKKHVGEDIPIVARRQNNEDTAVENTTKDSQQNAKVHKSYNLSFKFDKK